MSFPLAVGGERSIRRTPETLDWRLATGQNVLYDIPSEHFFQVLRYQCISLVRRGHLV